MMNEASHLVAEGVPIEKIDRAMLDWGFPVGPIKLTDEVGIDVGAKVGGIMQKAFGSRMAPPPWDGQPAARQTHGRKNGRGFYLYGDDKKKGVDPEVYEVLASSQTTRASRPKRSHGAAHCSSSTKRAFALKKASSEALATVILARCSASAFHPSGVVPFVSSTPSVLRISFDA